MKKTIVMIIAFFIAGIAFAKADVIVITHPETDISSIDENTLKEIYLGNKSKWKNNSKITLITLKEGDTHEMFLKKILKRTPQQYKYFWRKQLFLGKVGALPITCESMDKVIHYVSQNKGSKRLLYIISV